VSQARERLARALDGERGEILNLEDRLALELEHHERTRAERDAAMAELSAVEGRMRAVLSSRTWRWTAPVRWLLERLGSR